MSFLSLVSFLKAVIKLHTLPVVPCASHLQRESTKSVPLPHPSQGTKTPCKVGIRLEGVGVSEGYAWFSGGTAGIGVACLLLHCWGTLLLFVPISYSYTLNGKSLKGRHPPLFPHHLTHWYIVGSHYESFKNLQMIAEVDLRCITLLPYERSHYIEPFILTWLIPHINLFLCNLGKKKIYIYQVTGVVFDLL